MEDKSNHATPLRPQGDRILDAPLVEMDLNASIAQIRNERAWKESDRSSVTLFKSDDMRIVLIALHEQAEIKTHLANGIISVQVLEGCIRFTAGPKSVELQSGQMLALHKKIPHSVVAVQEAFFLLTLAVE